MTALCWMLLVCSHPIAQVHLHMVLEKRVGMLVDAHCNVQLLVKPFSHFRICGLDFWGLKVFRMN